MTLIFINIFETEHPKLVQQKTHILIQA